MLRKSSTLMNKTLDPLTKLIEFWTQTLRRHEDFMQSKPTASPLGQSIGLVVLLVATSAILLLAASSF